MSAKKSKSNPRKSNQKNRSHTKRKGVNSKKQTHFESKGQPQAINEKGIELEKTSMKYKYCLLGILAIAGVILCIFDIRDDGMILDFLGLFNYSGSLAGAVVIILCVWGIHKIEPKISIKS